MSNWNEPPKVPQQYILETVDGKRIEIRTDDRPKLLRALTVFGKGFRAQMFEEGTMAMSGAAGLWQGLKYKGDLKKGVLTAVVVDIAVSTFNGISNVVKHWEVL